MKIDWNKSAAEVIPVLKQELTQTLDNYFLEMDLKDAKDKNFYWGDFVDWCFNDGNVFQEIATYRLYEMGRFLDVECGYNLSKVAYFGYKINEFTPIWFDEVFEIFLDENAEDIINGTYKY